MSRSVWKGPYVDPNLIKKVEKVKNDPEVIRSYLGDNNHA